jgi:hypothetical protein
LTLTDGQKDRQRNELILDGLGNQKKLFPPGKKIVLVVCLAGAQSLLQPEKKVLVICLAGARLLIQPEKKKF